ncbi:hypothetical protein [Burkholderia ubonensis]|uniref:hypothetical protein n=1 Tax=Burkholderia ubonensis TaxID=101571 RepID=UPI00075CDBE3|nr:hypothetical protein [Burkholderia ubonensis]KVV12398.1 hypothetical protein WK77_06175 [Burkholderia ubonensis]
MFEWLKRLVARRELAELDELRREARMLEHARAENRDLRDMLAARGWRPVPQPLRVPPERVNPFWIEQFAREWEAASHETRPQKLELFHADNAPAQARAHVEESRTHRDGGIDYRFLGMTGEEDS